MKNKKTFANGIILITLTSLCIFVGVVETQTPNKPIIVCTTSATGNTVEEFLGDTVEILVLVQPSLCPADFDIKPGYIDTISKATILFKQNIPGEFWLDGLIESAGNEKLTTVTIPGAYNTPNGAMNYIRRVGGNLSQILNVNLDLKISQMLNELDDVTNWMTIQSEKLETSNYKVICMKWLKSFIESAGFEVVADYNPPETLSAGDITKILETAQSEGVALVVDNFQIDVEFGTGIANQVGAEHIVLTNFPGAIPKTETLSKMLRYNAEQLFNGTENWKSTSALKAEIYYIQNQLTIFQIATAIAFVLAIVEAILLYTRRKKKV